MSILIQAVRFNRTMSGVLARRLSHNSISPNTVTAAGLAMGFLGSFLISFGDARNMLFGAAALHLTFILDCADGDLARLTNRHSEFGRRFDVLCDLLVESALWSGLVFACREKFPVTELPWIYAAAIAGTVFNFLLIRRERRVGCSFHIADEKDEKRKNSLFFAFLESLAHNGISILFAYAAALAADPFLMLVGGAVFVNGLWLIRLAVNFRALMNLR